MVWRRMARALSRASPASGSVASISSRLAPNLSVARRSALWSASSWTVLATRSLNGTAPCISSPRLSGQDLGDVHARDPGAPAVQAAVDVYEAAQVAPHDVARPA